MCAVPATNKSREGVILRCLFFVKCAVLSYTSNRCSYSLNVRVYSYTWLNGCASNHHMTSTPIPSENGPEHRGQANRLRVSNICQQPHITSSHPLNIKHISLSYLIIKQAKSSERLKITSPSPSPAYLKSDTPCRPSQISQTPLYFSDLHHVRSRKLSSPFVKAVLKN